MTDIPESLRSALSHLYVIQRVIGRGGMATVYLAQDLKHGREVAVKVLRPDLAEVIGTERFLNEIEIAAQLTHPHILTLIDSGSADGFLYFVMPYVEGPSLRSQLNRERQIENERAVALTREVADALDYAHRQGIIHRDIKPENILLLQGHAVVTDFGIARAVITAGDERLTRSGFPLGTLGYMSPEQAAGRVDLSVATDVYSLGCVTYEMLVGDTPGMWPSDEAIKLRRFIDALPQHRRQLDALPGSLEQALVKAMAPRPEQRFATPGAYAAALERSYSDGIKYHEAQARQIMERAAELDGAEPTESGALSLGGIQQIAAEVGIAPEHVSEAAGDLVSRPTGLEFGGPMGVRQTIELERIVETEISAADYAMLLEEIRVSVGEMGDLVETLGTSLAWSSKTGGRRAQVLVSPRSGKTRIRITDDDVVPQSVAFIPLTVVSLIALGITGAIFDGAGAGTAATVAAAIGVSGSVFSGFWYTLRRITKRQMTRRFAKLSELMDRLTGLVREQGTAPGMTSFEPPELP
jgi:tRNA A-37 threonylcarbamoyl transferase component Bud32